MICDMMRIEVLLFASMRDLAGTDRLQLELPEGATVAAAAAALAERRPQLRAGLGAVRFAVDEEFAPGERVLRPGQTLALIPPVSGG
jgi:molybdopterin synthase catalytic subunit